MYCYKDIPLKTRIAYKTTKLIGTKKPPLSGFLDVTCRLSFLQRRELGGRPRSLTR